MGDAGPHQTYDPSYDYDTSAMLDWSIVDYGFVPNFINNYFKGFLLNFYNSN